MRTRRRTLDSRSLLLDNESRDALPSASSVDSSLLPLSTAAAAAAATTTTTVVTPGDLTGTPLLKSNVWEYFERCINVTPLKAKCLLCAEELLTPNYGTSSLKRHLAQRHNLKQFGSILSSRSSTTTVILSKTEKKKLDSLAIDAIIKDSRAFGDFQKAGFKKFMDVLKPGYKAPTRNNVVKKLKRLHQHHTIQTKFEFEQANYLSITCDFWTNRQQKSFLVITGHYIDKDFNEHSKILKFITFEERHFSPLIAQEIEKQLISLGLYDKLVTITCDGAANMRDMFTYFTRRKIKYIHCLAHKLHLIICNSLNLWVTTKKRRNTTTTETDAENSTEEEDAEDESQITLNQMIRTMSVDIHNISNENNYSDSEHDDESKSNKYINRSLYLKEDDNAHGESQSDHEVTDSISDEEDWVNEEDDDDEITDNFIEGVNTEEIALNDIQQKVREVIDIARAIVTTTKRTSILSTFIEKKRIHVNLSLSKRKKIKRTLSSDVKTRWNSTFKMLTSMQIYRDIINDMFKSKGSLGLTLKQRLKLTSIELSTDQWDLLELIISILEPFYSATKVLSNRSYPTIGSALYIIRGLEEHLQKEENNPLLNSLKTLVFIKFRHYMFGDTDQFNTFKLYGYFDPTGFSVLTKTEKGSIEKELVVIYKKEFESSSLTSLSSSSTSSDSRQTTKLSNIDKAWQGFLKITNKDLQTEVVTTTTSIQHEIKLYHNLATKL
ncbi:unnamed protein product [Rotaria magnacalcarata]